MNLRFKIAEFVGTVAYSGKLPVAPGTWGSLVALLVWYFIKPNITDPFFLLINGIIFFVGIVVSEILIEAWDNSDPKAVVIDEWVGMWIALIFVPRSIVWGTVAFFLFRLFDIWKPGPVKMMDNLHSAIGVMMDDVIAGIFALWAVHSLLYYFA